jgi:hypothetical protein
MSEAKRTILQRNTFVPIVKKFGIVIMMILNMPYEMLDLRLCKPARKRKALADCGLNKSIFNFSTKFGY